jgi:uncharacterized cupin superfamily protein
VSRASIANPVYDDNRDQPGFTRKRARLGRQVGSQGIGMSLFEVPPGEAAYPYHLHLAEEEIVVVLEGTPSLRTPDGWREMAAGEVAHFPTGEAGAHQIVNRTDGVVRFLAFSNQQPDIVIQPDSGKVGSFERLPDGGGLNVWFRRADEVGYFEGEAAP